MTASSNIHPAVQRIDALLAEQGVRGRVRLLAEAAPTAQAAADQLGCSVGAIANSLIFKTASGAPVLIMTSGAHRVVPALVAELLGEGIKRADADFVRRHTSQPIGGVAPIGHPEPIRTLIDRDLFAFFELWAAGGIPHAIFPLTYDELLMITGGDEAVVSSLTAS